MSLKVIEETDLYLRGIKNKESNLPFRLISLIQQNKHLHSISLVENEGQFLLDALTSYGKATEVYIEIGQRLSDPKLLEVDLKFLENKNRLFKKHYFSSESDLESYVLLSLKNQNTAIFKNFSRILNYFPDNNLTVSTIYNQFIFGNAYPSDIVILNTANVNIFELKKDRFSDSSFKMIRKEFKKYCYYSLYSPRLSDRNSKQRMNFFIAFPKDENYNFDKILREEFELIINSINKFRENNFVILEYYITDKELTFRALQDVEN